MNDRDKAELVFNGVIPEGEYNREVEIRGTKEGLEVDDYLVIPWEWIDEARKRFPRSGERNSSWVFKRGLWAD